MNDFVRNSPLGAERHHRRGRVLLTRDSMLAFAATGTAKLADGHVTPEHEQVRILRLVIGLMGILLPTVLFVGDWLFLAGSALPRGSVSAYYYSGMRDFLTGSLAVIGVCLATYRITDKHLENALSTIAGLACIVVAMFPTRRPPLASVPLTELQRALGEEVVSLTHLIAAIVFMVTLIVIGTLFAVREKGWLRTFLFICAGGMALASAGSFALQSVVEHYLLIGEGVSVFLFGVGWIVKGLFQ